MRMSENDPARPGDRGEVHGPKKFQWTPRAIGTVVGTVVGLMFVLSNRHTATIEFLWWQQDLPVWVALLFAIALGVLVGGGLAYRRGRATGVAKGSRRKKK